MLRGHGHFKEVCSCGAVIAQCRCPGPKEETVIKDGCPACKHEKEHGQFQTAMAMYGGDYRPAYTVPPEIRWAFTVAEFAESLLTDPDVTLPPRKVLEVAAIVEKAEALGLRSTAERMKMGRGT